MRMHIADLVEHVAAMRTDIHVSACPPKWAHFLAWPVLGTGILLAMSPSHDQMAASLRRSGLAGRHLCHHSALE